MFFWFGPMYVVFACNTMFNALSTYKCRKSVYKSKKNTFVKWCIVQRLVECNPYETVYFQ